jgi:hypothetical protein
MRLTGEALKAEIMMIAHDLGDEYGWDYVPNAQELLDYLADRTRKEYAGGSATYDRAEAAKYAEEAVARLQRSASRGRY